MKPKRKVRLINTAKKSKRRVRKMARIYIRKGWRVVPIPPKKKAPVLKGWQKLWMEESEVSDYLDPLDNIGILLGKPSKGLVDIDLDCEQAIFLAPHFLPETGRIHGRKSKPSSHYWYLTEFAPPPQKFCDTDDTCLVEIRSTGQQTIVPPSIHPSGERIRWFIKGRAGRVKKDADQFVWVVKKLAAATLLARHWPNQGSRNPTALALAGMLLNACWDDVEVANFISLVAQAAGDEESKARKGAALTTRKRIEQGNTFTGRPSLEKLLDTKVVDRACEWLGLGKLTIHAVANPPVTASPRVEADWPKPFSKRAYCRLAGAVVRAISPTTEGDEAGLLVQFLICFGNAIGRTAHVKVGSGEHYLNLFGVLVGRTAKARKGTSWNEIEHLFEVADPEWTGGCVLPGGLASGEGLIWAVRDPIQKKGKPRTGINRNEEVVKIIDEGVKDKRRLVLETEFSSPLRVMRREGNILSAVIRRAWDKGNLNNATKTSSARATGAHISIIGHITREELLHEFNASEGSNGFANRFLWICVKRARFIPIPERLSEDTFQALVERLQDALAFARKIDELKFSKQAKKLWCKVYRKLGQEVPGLLGAITSRPEPQVLRLAAIYALLGRSTFIDRKHLRAALAVWRYCENSARYIFGDKFGDPVVDTILRHLRREPKGLTRTDIREIFSRNRTENEINDALRILQENKFAQCTRENTGGRPSERWFAVR
jgi:hypothetical protein